MHMAKIIGHKVKSSKMTHLHEIFAIYGSIYIANLVIIHTVTLYESLSLVATSRKTFAQITILIGSLLGDQG